MDWLHTFGQLFTREGIEAIIAWGGLLILIAIVFAETGLLIGFFLPGDSLLITAGFVCATKPELLSIWQVLIFLSLAAIVGDSTGYAIGRRAGEALYSRPKSRWFHPDKLLKAKSFYDKYGPSAIVLARFVPFARTFAPVVAGIAEMDYRKFVTYNIGGGIGWVFSMSLLGYFFGQIPFVQHNLEKVLVLVILLSVLPVVMHGIKAKKEAAAEAAGDTPASESHPVG